MKTNKLGIESLKIEIPILEDGDEGILRGGFSIYEGDQLSPNGFNVNCDCNCTCKENKNCSCSSNPTNSCAEYRNGNCSCPSSSSEEDSGAKLAFLDIIHL